MKIAQHDVSLASQHTHSRQASRTETLRVWVGDQRPDFEGANRDERGVPASTRVAISDAARQAAAAATAAAQQHGAAAQSSEAEELAPSNPITDERASNPKLDLLIRIVEALTGEKIKLLSVDDADALSRARADKHLPRAEPGQPNGQPQAQPQPQGWGVEYEYHEALHEQETTSFMARGEVLTADGKRIQFDLALQMHREHHQEVSLSFQAGDAVRKDPLVINFDGNAAELSNTKFDFDIDGDGTLDNISFVGSGSGFLALDHNGNGQIDDGSELFGARTGNGFAELAAFDADGNGWIDENDGVYSELRIWTRNAQGVDQLSSLAERNVGAIYLGSAATPFDLKGAGNQQHGQVLSTGVYLSEDGQAGTIQQLDLFA